MSRVPLPWLLPYAVRSARISTPRTWKKAQGARAAARSVFLAFLLCLAAAGARADDGEPATHVYSRLYAGVGYMQNTSGQGLYKQAGAAVVSQLDLGFRVTHWLRVHGSMVFAGAPETNQPDYGTLGLRMTGFGGGATANYGPLHLAATLGTQWTGYITSFDSSPNGSDPGMFVGLTLGYVLPLKRSFDTGLHLVGRVHWAGDEFHGSQLAPHGSTFGLMLSIGFDGSPVL